jgi:hypothetical protein
MNRKLAPSGMVILVAAAFMTLGSFLPFWKTDIPSGTDLGVFAAQFADKTAWTSDAFFFPVTILPVVCGVLMAVIVALTTFTTTRSRPRFLGFTWNQLHLVLGLQAAVMMLAFLLQKRGIFSWGAGFYLMLVSGIGLAIGALMRGSEDPIR